MAFALLSYMIKKQVTDPVFPQCPIRNVLARIGDRWSLLILLALQDSHRQMRFKDLCQAIPDVSQKMLASTLKELEADGLVSRTAYSEIPPRVEYALTERGESLMPLLNQLVNWSVENMSGIMTSRKRYADNNNAKCFSRTKGREDGELDTNVVVAFFATTTKHGAIEGKTQVHQVAFYNPRHDHQRTKS